MFRYLIIVLSLHFASPAMEVEVDKTCQFLLQEFIELPDTTAIFTLSIAAPEVIRYRELSNLMEVQALRLMYAELGSAKVDFSVGYFQMKPSFIEELERRLTCDSVLSSAYPELIRYEQSTPAEIREARIDRILDKCTSWQYLQAFRDLIYHEHQEWLNCKSTTEQLRFIATAYNLGFGFNSKEILSYQQQQHFPYGSGFQGEQYAFGTLSVRIYDQLNIMLCASNF